MTRAYRVAVICGVIPLIVGVSVFGLWCLTRWKWLMVAGFFTIGGGGFLFLVGAIALARFYWLGLRTLEIARQRLLFPTLAGALLLLSNFIVAGVIILAVMVIETRYMVIIHNASRQPLKKVRVFGCGCDVYFGIIPSGGKIRRSFWIKGDGRLELSAVSNTRTYTEIIDGYATKSLGGKTTVTIDPTGAISASTE